MDFFIALSFEQRLIKAVLGTCSKSSLQGLQRVRERCSKLDLQLMYSNIKETGPRKIAAKLRAKTPEFSQKHKSRTLHQFRVLHRAPCERLILPLCPAHRATVCRSAPLHLWHIQPELSAQRSGAQHSCPSSNFTATV